MREFGLRPSEQSGTVHPNGWRRLVKRDMGLVRRILLHVEEKVGLKAEIVRFDDVDDDTVGRHVEMLFDDGMLDGSSAILTHLAYKRILVTDLSWAGHDFVAALQDAGVWDDLTKKLSSTELTSAPLSVIKALAVGLLEKYLKTKLGL